MQSPSEPGLFARRQLLLGLGAGVAVAAAPSSRAWAQVAPRGAGRPGQGRLVVVLLRGAYDGLSAFVPYADADYYALRPTIAVARPDGSAQTALRLDDTFALHPALSPLLRFWQQGVLGFVPAAGLAAPNRSHFDAQYQIEIGQVGKTSAAPGWLNQLSALDPSAQAIGVGEANPAILAGDAKVRLIARGKAAARIGVLANDQTRQALLDLYAGNDRLSLAFRQGAGSRMQSARELNNAQTTIEGQQDMLSRDALRRLDQDGTPADLQARNAQMLAASNGAADATGLQLDARHLGTLMRNDRRLRIGFLSAGGWDTHANQGNITGQLSNNLANLANAVAQLRQDFSDTGDSVVVMSEFGRTAAENGSRGTDHGFGNAMWMLGNGIDGGRWHGKWSGLAQANLNEARDLPAHHDYRAVLAQLLRATFALPDSALAQVLPGASWDTRLDSLIRRI